MDAPLRVLVVSEDPLARSGLAMLVAAEGFAVVGPYPPREAVHTGLVPPLPAVAAWDVGAEGSLERLRELDAARVPVAVLADDDTVATEALANGARGVFMRDVPGPRLGSALRAIVEGNVVLDEALASLLRPRLPSAPAEALTPRETEVLQQLAQGLSNKEIAQRLQVSEHTAKFHVNAILQKLGAQSRTEAVVRAARMGLLIL